MMCYDFQLCCKRINAGEIISLELINELNQVPENLHYLSRAHLALVSSLTFYSFVLERLRTGLKVTSKQKKVKVAQSCPTLWDPMDPMDYTVHGILQTRIVEWVAVPFSKGSSQPRDCPTLQMDSLPAEPPGKPKNTGEGSPSLLQGIFPTQESNQDLLHCRQILYRLSYQGSPF